MARSGPLVTTYTSGPTGALRASTASTKSPAEAPLGYKAGGYAKPWAHVQNALKNGAATSCLKGCLDALPVMILLLEWGVSHARKRPLLQEENQ